MKVAILETGHPPGPLARKFGNYPAMFAELLGAGFEVETFDVRKNLPSDPSSHAAYLITGSPAGVYDALEWIEPLKQFIRGAKRSKMVGICFGHQLMAEALGGKVNKSEKGWGVGLHRYALVSRAPWIDSSQKVAVPASHQDQVVVQPPRTRLVAKSDFTPLAALAWSDRPAISFQFHPEFSPQFAKALIEQRHDMLPDSAAAIASLDAPNDNARVGGWIRRFLEA